MCHTRAAYTSRSANAIEPKKFEVLVHIACGRRYGCLRT